MCLFIKYARQQANQHRILVSDLSSNATRLTPSPSLDDTKVQAYTTSYVHHLP